MIGVRFNYFWPFERKKLSYFGVHDNFFKKIDRYSQLYVSIRFFDVEHKF